MFLKEFRNSVLLLFHGNKKSVTCARKRRNIKGSDVSSAERACEAFIKKVKVKECK